MFWLLSGEGGLLRPGILESWPVVQLGLLFYSLYIWQQLFILAPGMRWLKLPVEYSHRAGSVLFSTARGGSYAKTDQKTGSRNPRSLTQAGCLLRLGL